MPNTKKLLKLVKKYSIHKNMLILNINNIELLNDFIDKQYKISIIGNSNKIEYKYMNILSNDIFNIRAKNNEFDLVCFNDLLEKYGKKDTVRILKTSISVGEAIIFDVTNFSDKRNIKYWHNLFEELNLEIIEEKKYLYHFFEKHFIFVVRKRLN